MKANRITRRQFVGLTAGGIRFTHCYSMPVCSPSRVKIMTGRYGSRTTEKWGYIPPTEKTFGHVLAKAGYATAIAGKWQMCLLKKDPTHVKKMGFDESCVFGWHEGPRYHDPFVYWNGEPRRLKGKYVKTRITSKRDGRTVVGGKGKLTDAGTRVPLIANWPGVAPKGEVCDDLIDFSDFLPTLADLARAELPRGVTMDGHSFAPRLGGKKGTPRKWCFNQYRGKAWVRTQRWKLYRSGRLFDMDADRREKRPIRPNQGPQEAGAARKKLQAVLDKLKP